MAVFDTIWIFMASALILASLAIIGFVVLKIGLASFKMAMYTVYAARDIEDIDFQIKNPKYSITEEEKGEIEFISNVLKSEIEKHSYTRYLYKLLKIEILFAHIDSIVHKIDSNMDIFIERIVSLTNSMESRIKKHSYTKYANIQLFKK
ncbi:MAG: hypothetical protein ACXVHW_10355 [Methanobacterium sp.]